MKDLWTYIREEHDKKRPVVLYGTGDGADKIYSKLRSDNVTVSGVFASDGFVRDRYYREMKVESFRAVMSRLKDPVVLVSFGTSRPEVIAAIDDIAAQAEVYAPDVPVCGGEIFDLAFYEKHREELDRVSSLLADELSRRCMENIILGKISGKIPYLHAAECTKEDIFSLTETPEGAVYFDLGAYNGDTVKEYSSRYPSISRIVAVEPEPHNQRKLNALKDDPSVKAELITYRALISDSCHDSYISAAARGRGTRANPATEAKTILTPAMSIDRIAEETGLIPDLIKFDIEGSEIEGIRGAEAVIAAHRPMLRIAAYHRSADLFEIAEAVLRIRSDYRIYMRHLPSIPAWDTDLIFV
ncbi:MAG: FkbM family methyltransferase [Lachnospiraceae bacterium]|nr:FkbM family methyltransferase [Lachnospiraceae bacterium]